MIKGISVDVDNGSYPIKYKVRKMYYVEVWADDKEVSDFTKSHFQYSIEIDHLGVQKIEGDITSTDRPEIKEAVMQEIAAAESFS